MPRCPFAVWKPISGSSGRHLGGPFKIVHHTTEGATAASAMAAFARHRSDPHFTVDATSIFQHIDTDEGARALVNDSGGVQTNRDSAVQIELVGFAHLPKDPRALANVARLCRWIELTHGVPREWPSGPPRPARNGRDPGGHNRDATTWDTRGGHYGHSHVPENVHWDPAYSATESAFVLAATFDTDGRLTSSPLPVAPAMRAARGAAQPRGRIRSTMPDHHDLEAPTRRRAAEVSLQSALRRPRICFERIVPDAQDPERHVRRALRGQMIAAAGRRLDADEVVATTRMAVTLSKRWGPGFNLRCRFLDGSVKMQAKVRRVCKEWERHANVRIRFVKKDPAEIRIAFFADEGSWSAVGRDALNTSYFPPHQPTMNFGWVQDDSDPTEDRAVILHEFGHALGCLHEHQSPTFGRQWNRAAVLRYFQGPPNYWSPADIQFNVLDKYRARGVGATPFDTESIMLYSFDAALFADGKGSTTENSQPSPRDEEMIARMYPA